MLLVKEIQEKIHDCGEQRYEIQIIRDGKVLKNASASDLLSERPEDATLGRDLNFIYGIIDIFQIAYEAGKNGEEVTYENIFVKENEYGEEVQITEEEFNQ